MTREELLEALEKARARSEIDAEPGHADADAALIAYINDEEVKQLYDSIKKWYA